MVHAPATQQAKKRRQGQNFVRFHIKKRLQFTYVTIPDRQGQRQQSFAAPEMNRRILHDTPAVRVDLDYTPIARSKIDVHFAINGGDANAHWQLRTIETRVRFQDV